MKRLGVCPACLQRQLVDHCEGGKCGWHRCRNTDCDAFIDFGKRRGHAKNPDPFSPYRRALDLGVAS